MTNKYTSSVALMLLLTLIFTACASGNPELPATSTLEPEPVESETPNAKDVSLCYNPLYPVKEGVTWTYQSTGGLSGNFSFTDTITGIREDGFTLESEFNGATLTQEWTCSSEGLASLSFGSGVAGGLSTSGVQMNLTTTNLQGVILPKTVTAGDQWAYSLDFDGTMEYGDTSVATQGTAAFTFSAIGEESVTVPAGTFQAMKIHADLRLTMDVTYAGFNAPVVFTIPSDIWYVPDVGWVKATSSGDIFGLNFNENIELQYFSVP